MYAFGEWSGNYSVFLAVPSPIPFPIWEESPILHVTDGSGVLPFTMTTEDERCSSVPALETTAHTCSLSPPVRHQSEQGKAEDVFTVGTGRSRGGESQTEEGMWAQLPSPQTRVFTWRYCS